MEGAEIAESAEIVESVETVESAETEQNAETETIETGTIETETFETESAEAVQNVETERAETMQNTKTTIETESAKTVQNAKTTIETESAKTVQNAKTIIETESAETVHAETVHAEIGQNAETETIETQIEDVVSISRSSAQSTITLQNYVEPDLKTNGGAAATEKLAANEPRDDSPSSSNNTALLLDLQMKDMGASFFENIRARLSLNKDHFERYGYCKIRITDFPTAPQLDAVTKKPRDSEVEEVEYTTGADTPEGFIQLSTHHGTGKVDLRISPGRPVSETPKLGFQHIFGTSKKAKYYVGPPLVDDSVCNSLLQCGPALAALQPLAGINSVYWMLGEAGSGTGLHAEDAWLHSANFVWTGAKDWLILSPTDKLRLEELIQKHFPEQISCSQAIRHLNLLVSPAVLEEAGIPFKLERCIRGEGIITAPKAYHQVINSTYCFATAINLDPRPVFKLPRGYICCTRGCGQDYFIAKDNFRQAVAARRAISGKSRHVKPVSQPRRDLSPKCHELVTQNKYKPLMNMKVKDPFECARVLQLALQCYAQDIDSTRFTIKDRPLRELVRKLRILHGKNFDCTLEGRLTIIKIYQLVEERKTAIRIEMEEERDKRRRMTRQERQAIDGPNARRTARDRALLELLGAEEKKLLPRLSAIVTQGEVLASIAARLGEDFLRRLPFTTIESEFLRFPWPDPELNKDIHPTE